MKKLLFILPLMTLFCGCNIFLPAGEAPEGAITDNAPERELSHGELVNNAVTSLTVFLLTHTETFLYLSPSVFIKSGAG